MVTGKQTQHVLHREQCTKTILWSSIDVTMSKSYFGPEYCVGNSDNTTFKSSMSGFVSACFTFKTSIVGFHGEPASPLLLMFARAPDCIQNQNAISILRTTPVIWVLTRSRLSNNTKFTSCTVMNFLNKDYGIFKIRTTISEGQHLLSEFEHDRGCPTVLNLHTVQYWIFLNKDYGIFTGTSCWLCGGTTQTWL